MTTTGGESVDGDSKTYGDLCKLGAGVRHTPGPWVAAAKPSSVVGWPIVAQSGRSVASVTYVQHSAIDPAVPGDRAFNAESSANAHLLAAAPDLLEAATEAAGCFSAALCEGWLDAIADGDIDRIRDLWERRISYALAPLSAAIAKAEGRAQ